MVKGNWERRAELADLRRAEAKARKQARGQPKPPTGVGVIRAILRNEDITSICCNIFLENEGMKLKLTESIADENFNAIRKETSLSAAFPKRVMSS